MSYTETLHCVLNNIQTEFIMNHMMWHIICAPLKNKSHNLLAFVINWYQQKNATRIINKFRFF